MEPRAWRPAWRGRAAPRRWTGGSRRAAAGAHRPLVSSALIARRLPPEAGKGRRTALLWLLSPRKPPSRGGGVSCRCPSQQSVMTTRFRACQPVFTLWGIHSSGGNGHRESVEVRPPPCTPVGARNPVLRLPTTGTTAVSGSLVSDSPHGKTACTAT